MKIPIKKKNINIADVIDSGSNESGGDEAHDDDLEGDIEALQLEDDSPIVKPQVEKRSVKATAGSMSLIAP